MQNQLVCSGCRSILLYPRGATNVCCAICNTVTQVPPPGMETTQLICGGCRTLLMYARGGTSVRCSCCHTINLAPASNQIAHINCGHCRTTLMYPSGAPSVKCAVCQYVTNVGVHKCMRVTLPSDMVKNCFEGNILNFLLFSWCRNPPVYTTKMGNARVPFSGNRPNQIASTGTMPSTSSSQTVVVENPMSVDESGKLVSNVVVGVTTERK